jgi:cAMP-dependent protein kinase regulator
VSEHQEVLRRARERWMEGEADALSEFERGIELALAAGDIPAALAAHQKLLVWRPDEAAMHERVARAIAAARDRDELASASAPSLDAIPLFSGIPREELVSVLTAVRPEKVSAGQAVVREGEAGDTLYLIVQGTLRVSTKGRDGEDVALAALGAGDFFGEVALLTGRPRTATVSALTETELLVLDRATVDRLRAKHPQIEASLTEFHRRRAERTVEALVERLVNRGPELLGKYE